MPIGHCRNPLASLCSRVAAVYGTLYIGQLPFYYGIYISGSVLPVFSCQTADAVVSGFRFRTQRRNVNSSAVNCCRFLRRCVRAGRAVMGRSETLTPDALEERA